MREFIEFLARSLVDRPGEVQVREVTGDRVVLFEIQVAPDDVGKVIGRQGRVIQAIRSLARSAGTRQGKRVTVEVIRPR